MRGLRSWPAALLIAGATGCSLPVAPPTSPPTAAPIVVVVTATVAPTAVPTARSSETPSPTTAPTATLTTPDVVPPLAPPSLTATATPTLIPTPPAPIPTTPPAATAVPQPPIDIGLAITAPLDGVPVASKVLVRGVQARPLPPGHHAWLLVRAQLEGGQWYAHPREILVRSDGTWDLDITIGGPPGVSHELVVVQADPEAHAFLTERLRTVAGQPLPAALPGNLWTEAQIVVVRQ